MGKKKSAAVNILELFFFLQKIRVWHFLFLTNKVWHFMQININWLVQKDAKIEGCA